jgi:hypothetical protein
MTDIPSHLRDADYFGVLNIQKLKEFPPQAPKDYQDLKEVWPSPAEIWHPIPYTSKQQETLKSADPEVTQNILPAWKRTAKESLTYQNRSDDEALNGRWLPLDVAFNWGQKRGSGQPSKLSVNYSGDPYPEDVLEYNENMHPYLKTYLIEDSDTKSKVIYLATSFQTDKSIYYPVFLRFTFNPDKEKWESDVSERQLKTGDGPYRKDKGFTSQDPYLLELKQYRTGRSSKIGLFTNADKIDMAGVNQLKTKGATRRDKGNLWGFLLDANYGGDNLYANAYEALSDNINKKTFTTTISNQASKTSRPHWLDWAQSKTLTNRKNRNQIYIWIPAQKEKYDNPANQLGLFNWSSAFWEKD